MSSIQMLRDAGVSGVPSKNPKAWRMHAVLFSATGTPQPENDLQLFHVMREMRNCQIHAQGAISDDLRYAVFNVCSEARDEWLELTGKRLDILTRELTLTFSVGHIIASFALVKRIEKSANIALQTRIPKTHWAETVVEEFSSSTTKV